jgi:hypothetical protein
MHLKINRPPNGDRIDFKFTWLHKDGSIVIFCADGWSASDPGKTAWLNEMSHLTSSEPIAPPLVRIWLEQECRLIEAQGPERPSF